MKFYLQQIAGTVAIVCLWAFALYHLTMPAPPAAPATVASSQVSGAASGDRFTIATEQRDEKTGESLRRHFKDEHGTLVKTEIVFRDGVTGTLVYDWMGRVTKAVEKNRDGTSQVFTLRGRQVALVQSFRADGTLRSQTSAAGNDAVEVTRFAADGKTRESVQKQFANGRVEAESFYPSGVRKARVELVSQSEGTVMTFDQSGKLVSKESFISEGGECGDPMCHECGGRMSSDITIYRGDGSLWISQNVTTEYGSPSITGKEFGADGKTVTRELNPESVPSGPQGGVVVDVSGGKPVRAVFLNHDGTVDREVIFGTDGSSKAAETTGGKGKKLELELLRPRLLKDELVPQLVLPAESNHLRQMLSR